MLNRTASTVPVDCYRFEAGCLEEWANKCGITVADVLEIILNNLDRDIQKLLKEEYPSCFREYSILT